LNQAKFSRLSRIFAGFKKYDIHTPVHNGNCCLAAAKPPYLTVPANLGHIKVKFVGQSGYPELIVAIPFGALAVLALKVRRAVVSLNAL
jgi:hypothetical protein